MVAGIKEPENEDEVIAVAVNNCYEDKEEEKRELVESGRGPVGRHLRTKAEAYEYLADLSNYPRLANWLAGEAREEEARRLRRTGNKKRRKKNKRKGVEIQVTGGVEGSTVLGTDAVLAPENEMAPIGVAESVQGSNYLGTYAHQEYENAVARKQEVAEGAQGSTYLGMDAVLESENAVAQQQNVDDTGNRNIGNTSIFGERTEPTGNGNVLEKSASVIDFCFSCSEEVGVKVDATTEESKMKAEKDDFIDTIVKGEQAENNAGLERTVSLEAQPVHKKNIIPVKLLRAPRYFEPQESNQQKCRSCGEDNHIAAECIVLKKKKKVCFICGSHWHHGKHCKKVTKCLFCGKKGHLAKDCPREDIVRKQTSNFCLRCANSGHDIFLCTYDYATDDLERIQCYVCKAFGHLCCVSYRNGSPRSVSCYNCGESNHLGSECKKLHGKSSASQSALVHRNGGVKGHLAQECNESEKAKEVSGPTLAKLPKAPKQAKLPNVPTLAKLPKANNYVPMYEPPHRFGKGPPMKFWHNERTNAQQRWPQWRGFNYPQQQRPFSGQHRSNVWLSPMAADERNNISSSNSSSQSSIQHQQ